MLERRTQSKTEQVTEIIMKLTKQRSEKFHLINLFASRRRHTSGQTLSLQPHANLFN